MAAGQMKASGGEGKTDPARRQRLRGMALGLIGVGVVLLAAALVGLRVIPTPLARPSLTGAVVNPPAPAADFHLQDQFGQNVALDQFRGKVVVLTFLYTNCPDACPLITQKLHQAYDLLGGDTQRTAILAVTVDPTNDTTAVVRNYSAQKDMLQKWHFLVGPRASVEPVWQAYGIYAAPDTTPTPVSAATPSSGPIDHTAPIFVIDPSGNLRALLDTDFAPADLVQDVRALLS